MQQSPTDRERHMLCRRRSRGDSIAAPLHLETPVLYHKAQSGVELKKLAIEV